MAYNAFYAQSGGVTSVINASALGLLDAADRYPDHIAQIYAGQNGIIGALREELLEISALSVQERAALGYSPGGAFGSCRYKLSSLEKNKAEYQRLLEVFQAHNIRYFFYNGGGDSQDTAHKVSLLSQEWGYPLCAIGIPKTVDNDLPFTDHSPGFGSVAKYIATSILEASYDVASMYATSTKVFILEVMGRHAGWIAASAALAQREAGDPPHLILFPERPIDRVCWIKEVQAIIDRVGYCVVVASEGLKNTAGAFLSDSGLRDAFGHAQLGGVAPLLAQWVKEDLKLKCHWAVPDYLQRSGRHLSSQCDWDHAYALGKAAVELAMQGHNRVMPIIQRLSDHPYEWTIGHVPLEQVANCEKKLPDHYIREDGYGITPACRDYLLPLIQGEAYPPFENGIPAYRKISLPRVPQKCAPYLIR